MFRRGMSRERTASYSSVARNSTRSRIARLPSTRPRPGGIALGSGVRSAMSAVFNLRFLPSTTDVMVMSSVLSKLTMPVTDSPFFCVSRTF